MPNTAQLSLRCLVLFSYAIAARALLAQSPANAGGPAPVQPPASAERGRSDRPRFPRPPIVQALDADESGDLSPAEVAGAAKSLQAIDKDKDNQLTEDELRLTFTAGPFGPGGMMRGERKLVARFDRDADGRLDADERRAARESLDSEPGFGGPGGFGGGRGPGRFGPGFGRAGREPAKPGPAVSPGDVPRHADAALYDPAVLRTIFITFENDDWEAELAAFKGSDVEVPATLVVDGTEYPGVGVHFRGMSSFMMVPAGYKRSLNVSLDYTDPAQRLYGYKMLNLLNANGDPSFLSSPLYSHIARKFVAAPKANLVRVVINGESWGVYANVQQFDKVFVSENFQNTEGVRWKVSGNPGGGGGLEYLGADRQQYQRRYELKSKDSDKAWHDLINLCRVLNETPPDQLEQALAPIVDVDGLLAFLALDVALCNSDGYWTRASDYTMYQNPAGVFHFIPHDMNEAFHGDAGPGGRGRRGRDRGAEDREPSRTANRDGVDQRDNDQAPRGFGPPGAFADEPFAEAGAPEFNPPDRGPAGDGGEARGFGPRPFGPGGFGPPGFGPGSGPPGFAHGGVDLDPLVAIDDPRKPLRSKVLAVPALRARYLDYVRQIAEELDWETLGPVVAQYRSLIEDHVAGDTRKLSTLEAFQQATEDSGDSLGNATGLRTFAAKRREYLLGYSATNRPEASEAAATADAGRSRGEGPGNRGFEFGPPSLPLNDALDRDDNGTLSKQEIDDAASALAQLDKDGDKRLSAEEIGWPPAFRGGFPGFGPPRDREPADEPPG